MNVAMLLPWGNTLRPEPFLVHTALSQGGLRLLNRYRDWM